MRSLQGSGVTPKALNLGNFYSSGITWTVPNIVQELLEVTRSRQDELCDDVSYQLENERKLKEMEALRDKLIEFDILLLRIYRGLDKSVAQAEGRDAKEKQEALLKQCVGLQSINEKTKKLVTDDIANHKSYAVNAITAAGTMLVTPFSVEKIVETFASKQPSVLSAAYDAGAVLGIYLAFHHQWNKAAKRAVRVVAKMPNRIKTVHHHARNAAFALTMSISISAKKSGEIESRQPDRLAARPNTTFVAKM